MGKTFLSFLPVFLRGFGVLAWGRFGVGAFWGFGVGGVVGVSLDWEEEGDGEEDGEGEKMGCGSRVKGRRVAVSGEEGEGRRVNRLLLGDPRSLRVGWGV